MSESSFSAVGLCNLAIFHQNFVFPSLFHYGSQRVAFLGELWPQKNLTPAGWGPQSPRLFETRGVRWWHENRKSAEIRHSRAIRHILCLEGWSRCTNKRPTAVPNGRIARAIDHTGRRGKDSVCKHTLADGMRSTRAVRPPNLVIDVGRHWPSIGHAVRLGSVQE